MYYPFSPFSLSIIALAKEQTWYKSYKSVLYPLIISSIKLQNISLKVIYKIRK